MAAYFDYKFRVGYVDTDKMGIVHNSNYFRYFEMAKNNARILLKSPGSQPQQMMAL